MKNCYRSPKKMRRLTYSTVLVLLYLQWGCQALPVDLQAPEVQNIYSYKASVTTKSSASDDIASVWTLSGNLTVQATDEYAILKLNGLKTFSFNGPISELKNVDEVDIPDEAKIITEPFVIQYEHYDIVKSLSHVPEEPMWSLNMKRAIGSLFHGTNEVNESRWERSIYGNCKVHSMVKNLGDTEIVEKTIDRSECTDQPYSAWASVEISPNTDHELIKSDIKRVLIISTNNNVLNRLEATSNTVHQRMPGELNNQIIEQKQIFELLDRSSEFEKIDISRITVDTNLTFAFPETTTDTHRERHKTEQKSQAQLMVDWLNQSKDFQSQLNQDFLTNIDIHTNDTLEELYWIMDKLDKETLHKIRIQNKDLEYLFTSLLSYVGSNDSIVYIKDMVEDNSVDTILLLRLLGTFPSYVSEPSEELLEKMKGLLELKTDNVHVKNAGILSFASLVSYTYYLSSCSQSVFKQYVDKYLKLYHDAEDYELQMTYLLGLINLGEREKIDILSIIMNNNESHHLRSMAIYAYKHQLKTDADEVYEKFFPIYGNKSEHFEVRVAALDLLLSSDLNEEQFDEILSGFNTLYKNNMMDLTDKYLYNYFYTTLQSLQNSTGYNDNLSYLATSRFLDLKVPFFTDSWTTGNYRVSYTDDIPNFGASFQTRLVASPSSNIINVVQLTYNQFAMSLDLGTYSVYIKWEGINDGSVKNYMVDFVAEPSLPELVELIQKHAYKLREKRDFHVEFVIFCDNRAVFSLYFSQNIDDFPKTQLFTSASQAMGKYSYVSFPAMSYDNHVSDLGTPLTAKFDYAHIWSHSINNHLQAFSDMKQNETFALRLQNAYYYDVQFESYNPISDISHGAFKHFGKRLKFVFDYTVNASMPFYFSTFWENKNDTLNIVEDNLIGIYADDNDVLKTYCPDCDSRLGIADVYLEDAVIKVEALGVSFNLTEINCTAVNFGNLFFAIGSSHRSNYYAFPPAKPLLLVSHYLDFMSYLTPLQACALSSRTFLPYNGEPTQSFLEYKIIGQSLYKDNDPYEGFNLNFSLEYKNKRIRDDHLYRLWNVSIYVKTEAKNIDEDSELEISNNYGIQIANIFSDESKSKFCLNQEIVYPNRRLDRYKMKPSESAKGKTTFSWGNHDLNPDTCPTDKSTIVIDESASVSGDQIKLAALMDEAQTCKKLSSGLKYTPPTQSCIKVFKELSNYREYYASFTFNSVNENQQKLLKHLNEYLHFEQNKIPQNGLFTEQNSNISLIYNTAESSVDIDINDKIDITVEYPLTQSFVDLFLLDPITAANEYNGVKYGIERSCIITPKNVQTFIGENVERKNSEINTELVAFVDCLNNNRTHNGMTFQILSDTQISLKFWSGDNVLTITPEEGQLKVILNGQEKNKDNFVRDKKFNVHFLSDDVIYIRSPIAHVYYNTEYISIKAYASYNQYVCGVCNDAKSIF